MVGLLCRCCLWDLHTLLHFSAVAGCSMVLLGTNKSKDRHRQPFFNIFVVRSKGCEVYPSLKLWALILSKNEKMKKMNYIRDQEEHKGGERWDLLCNTFFVFAKQIFSQHLIFFILELVVVFARIIDTEELNLSSECELRRFDWFTKCFNSRWKSGRLTDSKDMLQTLDWANSGKMWPAIQFCPWDFWCPCPKDLSGTFWGHFQLRHFMKKDPSLVGNDSVMTTSSCNKMGLSLNPPKKCDIEWHLSFFWTLMWGIPEQKSWHFLFFITLLNSWGQEEYIIWKKRKNHNWKYFFFSKFFFVFFPKCWQNVMKCYLLCDVTYFFNSS